MKIKSHHWKLSVVKRCPANSWLRGPVASLNHFSVRESRLDAWGLRKNTNFSQWVMEIKLTDKSKFEIYGRTRICKLPNETINTNCIVIQWCITATMKHGGENIPIWGCVTTLDMNSFAESIRPWSNRNNTLFSEVYLCGNWLILQRRLPSQVTWPSLHWTFKRAWWIKKTTSPGSHGAWNFARLSCSWWMKIKHQIGCVTLNIFQILFPKNICQYIYCIY